MLRSLVPILRQIMDAAAPIISMIGIAARRRYRIARAHLCAQLHRRRP